ncbi:MAG TPA: flagellar hook capping FlgD N-terminal domain-containing protein [Gemmatimonadaceae bacterium]|jgi:flagellar basal-body rod modification protein FlgD
MISAVNSKPLYSSSTTGTTGTSGSGSSTSGTTGAAAPGGAMGKDEFMKLLVAQMQNQDPMNPMQGDQMAAQLAQFSSLEQLTDINTTLTGQSSSSSSLLGAMQTNGAMSTIGHNVLAIGDGVQVGGTAATQSVTVDVAANVKSAKLNILDSNGKVIGSRDLGAFNGGRQSFDLGDATKDLPAGNYSYAIDAQDASGNAVNVTTYMNGRVDGISSGTNGLVLNMGSLQIPYANVVAVNN